MDLLTGLNAAQREAVEYVQGPLLILAGPGSGKTRVISHRVAYLVRTCGVRAYRIMAMTFTNKAAREMKTRISALLGKGTEDLSIGTFHAICAGILRREAEKLDLDRSFVIYDDEDQLDLLKQAMEDVKVDPKTYSPRSVLSHISAAKSQLIGPEEHRLHRSSYFDEVVQRCYERYQELLDRSQALDFDDLLFKTYLLFQGHAEVLHRYQARLVHLMVDEFQDTNIAQYAIVKLLAGQNRNLCVVGDPDQSIYSWRSADIRNILNFERDYPDAKVVLLEQNYRSTQRILQAAQGVISQNRQRKEKGLWTQNASGQPVSMKVSYDEHDEALSAIQIVEQLKQQGHRYSDIAIMYRTNAQSRPLEETIVRYGIPYRLVGALRFYQRKEVKDVLAYLRLVQNPEDSVSLLRIINVPSRSIGQRTVDELQQLAQQQGISLFAALSSLDSPRPPASGLLPLSARSLTSLRNFLALVQGLMGKRTQLSVVGLLDAVLGESGYKRFLLEGSPDGQERWENIQELRTAAKEYEALPPQEGLASFLESVALVSDVDNLDEAADAMTLITLHQAKGLEFPVVIMVGVEEGLLPHFRALESGDPAELEEERRLCYVGMTRAKELLYLLRALRRSFMGGGGANPPSRFLQDIPSETLRTLGSLEPHGADAHELPRFAPWRPSPTSTAASSVPPSAFKPGDQVRHATFGEGMVLKCQPSGSDTEVTVAFKGAIGTKRLLLGYAKLEAVAKPAEK